MTQLAVTGASRGEPVYYSNEKCRTLFGLSSQLYTITTDADVFATTLSSQAQAGGGTKKDADEQDQTDTQPAVDKSLLPASSEPIRTQLGGKKAVTASGVVTLKGSNNKITILGANGKEKKAAVLPETYTFTGKGWGHAVGMSQEGAIGMGKAGFTYDQILTHYFQGTKVE